MISVLGGRLGADGAAVREADGARTVLRCGETNGARTGLRCWEADGARTVLQCWEARAG